MQRESTGRYELTSTAGETVRAFVPDTLPPEPPVLLEGSLQALHERALLACGRLDGVSTLLPDPELFLYAYVRREALLSSQIEGTQSSLSDLLLFELEEAPGVPFDDVVDVSSYVAGLEHGLARLSEGFPCPLACCARSMAGCWPVVAVPIACRASSVAARTGSAAPGRETPGSCRRRRLWWRTAWGSWSNSSTAATTVSTPCRSWAALPQPVFQAAPQPLLRAARWCPPAGRLGGLDRDFFLEGVESTASAAVATAQRLLALFRADEERLAGLGRSGPSVRQGYAALRRRPLTSTKQLKELSGLSFPTAGKALETLVELGIAREITGGQRNRLFAYDAYLAILSEGAEPL